MEENTGRARFRGFRSLRMIPARHILTFVIAIGMLPYVVLMVHPSTKDFAPDSWSYYDLSETVFGDFYHPSTTRAYDERGGYSHSFPPLWPVLIAVSCRIFRRGPEVAVQLAAVIALLTFFPLRMITGACIRRRSLSLVSAVTAWLSLLVFFAYSADVERGMSGPLGVLLLTSAAACLLRDDIATRWVIAGAAGLLLGLGSLARFDALVFGCVVSFLFITLPSIRAVSKVSLFLAFCIAISPWVVYSKRHYGTLWTSEQFFVAMSAIPVDVTVYKRPIETAVTNPTEWAAKEARNGVKLLSGLSAVSGRFYPVSPLFIVAAWAVWAFGIRRRSVGICRRQKRLLLLIGGAFLGLGGQLVTGLVQPRYFSFICALTLCWAASSVFALRFPLRAVVGLELAILLLFCPQSVLSSANWMRPRHHAPQLTNGPWLPQLGEHGSATLLAGSPFCQEVGARTRNRTVCLPSDWPVFTHEERERFVSRYGITHALLPMGGPNAGGQPIYIVPIEVGLDRLVATSELNMGILQFVEAPANR
jgi:hypothetical protein